MPVQRRDRPAQVGDSAEEQDFGLTHNARVTLKKDVKITYQSTSRRPICFVMGPGNTVPEYKQESNVFAQVARTI